MAGQAPGRSREQFDSFVLTPNDHRKFHPLTNDALFAAEESTRGSFISAVVGHDESHIVSDFGRS